MCWSCNPYCGGCKPPKTKPVRCPVCKTYNFPELTHCKKCGALLPEPPPPIPAFCLYLGRKCANPCNKRLKTPNEGELPVCNWHTPMPEENNA